MIAMSMKVINSKEFNVAMAGFAKNLKDASPVWPGFIEGGLRPILAGQKASRGAEGAAGPWQALTRDYVVQKASKYGEQQILVRTGRMWDSLLQDTGDTYIEMSPTSLKFGTTVQSESGFPYAIAMQTGFRTRLGQGKGAPKPDGISYVPPRRLVDLTAESIKELVTAFQRSLVTYLTRLGYRILGADATRAEATHAGAIAVGSGPGGGAP